MNTPICSQCGAPVEAASELNRVGDQVVCWTCLVPNVNEKWRVTVHWAGDNATVREVSHLRALFPKFQQESSRELWASLKDETEVVVGEFYRPHLEQLLSRNEEYGLNLVVQNTLEDDADSSVFQRLLLAIQRDDAEQVSALAGEAHDINALTKDGTDLLSYALEAQSEAAAAALISAGIDLANRDSIYTAMQTALENGASNIVNALLDRKADLNARGTEEEAYAIHVLCQNYLSSELLSRFLESGADPNAVDDFGKTAVMILQEALNENGPDPETEAMIELLERAEGAI